MSKEYDVLNEWRKNVITESSPLNPRKSIEFPNRENIHIITDDLRSWLGDQPFIIENKEIYEATRESFIDGKWLHSILFAKNLKSIQTVIEFWKVLKFHQSVDKTRLASLENLLHKKNKRHFRDYYFELYTFYLFSINNIENEFKTKEGNKELEGEIVIDGEKCLVECRKLYYNKYEHLKMNADLMHKIIRYVYKNPIGIIVCVQYKKVDRSAVDRIMKKIKMQINKWTYESSSTIYLPVKIQIDNQIEMKLYRFSPNSLEGIKSSMELDNYIIAEINPIRMTDGSNRTYVGLQMDNRVVSTDLEANSRFIEALIKKRKNRAKSSFKHRIYIFESENYSGFDRGLFIFDGYNEKTQDKLQVYLDSKETSDTVIMILKESNPVNVDRVRLVINSNERGKLIAEKMLSLNF